MKTKPGSMANRHKTTTSESRSEEVADFHTLSELVGLNIPPHTMRVMLELIRNGVPPATVYSLLRSIAAKTSKQAQSSSVSRGEHISHSSTSKH